MNYAVNFPERNMAGHSPRYSVRNPENYLGGYRASNWSGYLPENPASSREDCLDSNSADPSADCPDNRPERNPENNLESNGAGYSESYSVDSLPDCLASYPESFGPRPVCRGAAATELLQLDDLAAEVLPVCIQSHEVNAGGQDCGRDRGPVLPRRDDTASEGHRQPAVNIIDADHYCPVEDCGVLDNHW